MRDRSMVTPQYDAAAGEMRRVLGVPQSRTLVPTPLCYQPAALRALTLRQTHPGDTPGPPFLAGQTLLMARRPDVADQAHRFKDLHCQSDVCLY
jgi:hypothetical protein